MCRCIACNGILHTTQYAYKPLSDKQPEDMCPKCRHIARMSLYNFDDDYDYQLKHLSDGGIS